MKIKVTRDIFIPVASVLVALGFGAILIAAQGHSPLQAYHVLIVKGFQSTVGLQSTLSKAGILIMSGLAITIGLRAGLFNIGAQGQVLSGALAFTYIGYRLHGVPMWIHIPVALIVGAAFGAFVGGFAGFLKATRGVHEVIST